MTNAHTQDEQKNIDFSEPTYQSRCLALSLKDRLDKTLMHKFNELTHLIEGWAKGVFIPEYIGKGMYKKIAVTKEIIDDRVNELNEEIQIAISEAEKLISLKTASSQRNDGNVHKDRQEVLDRDSKVP